MAIIFSNDLTVAAPVERVFAAQIDFDSWRKWMPNLIRLEKLNDKAFGPGFRWREVRKMFGREASEVFEVVGMERNVFLALRIDGREGTTGRGIFNFRHDYVPKGGLTVLSTITEIEGMGWIGELMFKFIGGSFKRAVAADMAAFKAYVERGGLA
jgi:uncharacterized protein YndB with AHSA1/START domain